MLERDRLERLFRQHYGKMTRQARAMLDDGAEAEDVVQDVFARLTEADLLPTEDRTEAYLLTATRHACLNAMRRKSVWQRVRSLYPMDCEETGSGKREDEERAEAIWACARQLEEPHRSIFRLRFEEDLTVGEIARRLQLNANTCYKYLRQSMEYIRKRVTF